MSETEALLRVEHLKKYFKVGKHQLHAVDDVSFTIQAGQTLGVVGESGCGKSTLGRTLVGLYTPTDGKVFYRGQDVFAMGKREIKQMNRKISMIFQDPYSSLNPRMCVADLIADPMRVNHFCASKEELNRRVAHLMDLAGLASRVAGSYPHELDGGRRQRIGIARALACQPEFIVCDEPVSALDVSIQAQILNLLMDLQDEMKLTYLFVTHDLSVVRHISTNIMVVYLGQCVELGTAEQIFANPLHPYTRALLSALPEPTLEARNRKPELLTGEISNPIDPKPGCRFAPRCKHCTADCMAADIPLRELEPGHQVACCKAVR